MEILQSLSLTDALGVATRTLTVFFFAFFILRFLGKTQLSKPTYIDFLFVVVLGAAVSSAMINEKSFPQTVYLIFTMLTVGLFVKIVNEITTKSKSASALFMGDARLVIRGGKILHKAIEKENLSKEALTALLRDKGLDSPLAVDKAYLEADGGLSVIENKGKKDEES